MTCHLLGTHLACQASSSGQGSHKARVGAVSCSSAFCKGFFWGSAKLLVTGYSSVSLCLIQRRCWMLWINEELVICQSVAPGIVAVEQERGHGTLAVRGASLGGKEPESVSFSWACWNTEVLMAMWSEKTWEQVCITWPPKDLGVPKVGVPGYSGFMKYKARKK